MFRPLFILSICFLASFSNASAQRKEFRHFLQENRGGGAAFHIGLSFLPLRVVSWFIPKRAFNGDAADIKWALKKVRRVRVYTLAEGDFDRDAVNVLKAELRDNRKYEPLMEFKQKSTNVELMSKGRHEDRLDNLVVIARNENNLVMVHLRTKITIKDLNHLVDRLTDDVARN